MGGKQNRILLVFSTTVLLCNIIVSQDSDMDANDCIVQLTINYSYGMDLFLAKLLSLVIANTCVNIYNYSLVQLFS